MTHIEFLGQPGAGKSTIYSRLIESDVLFGSTKQDAVRRMVLKKSNTKQRAIYKLTPTLVRSFFEDNFLQYRLGHNAIEEFIRNYPEYIKEISIAMESVSHEPERVFSLCQRSAEQYQLGTSTISKEEVLCLDESFAQRAFSILWREPDNQFSMDRYLDVVPIPKLLVYVDAPIDLCLERQQDRGRVTVSKEWETSSLRTVQKKSQNICMNICNHFENKTNVVNIKNTGSVSDATERIQQEITQL